MKKDFLVKISVLPITFGIILAVAAITFFCVNADVFIPVYEGSVIAYHEKTVDTAALAESFENAKDGDTIGTVNAKKSFPIVVNAPYHQLDDVLSYESGEFGVPGTVYIKTDNRVLKTIEKSISFRAEGCFDTHDYVLVNAKDFSSVEALQAYTPDVNKGIVIYAQSKGKIGLSSGYRALVFEEVQL